MKLKNLTISFTLLLLSLLLLQCKNAPETSIKGNEIIDFTFNNKQQTLVSAHRGGSGIKNYPENCLETIDYLYNKGITIFEVDLSMSRDNEIVLMHDKTLERTTTGNDRVEKYNLEELKKLNLVDDFGNKTSYNIPTLKELLEWLKGKNAVLMLDFKPSVAFEDAINLVNDKNVASQCVLISYSVGQAKKLHSLASNMMLSVSMRNEDEFNRMLASGIPTKNMIAFTGTRKSPKSLYDKIHEKNILAIFGTLGNIDKSAEKRGDKIYKDLEKIGVDIFATDRPIAVLNAINKK